MSDPLKPSPALLSKLGSIIVHFDEWRTDSGHAFDLQAADSHLQDPEVVEWLKEMTAMAFLPVKR